MQAQYARNYPSGPAQRSPQVRRGPGPMLNPQAAPNHQALANQHAEDQRRRELARRQARKPTDKNMPEGLEEVVIGEGVERYRDLRDVERRLDAVMMRKRLDITDSINRNLRRYRTLRIWISNTAENQSWQQLSSEAETFDFNSDAPSRYKVKIEGRLLDDDEGLENDILADAGNDENAMDTDAGDAKPKTPTRDPRFKLSHFFKQITIDFDRAQALQPDNFNQIEWKKPEARPKQPIDNSDAANFDCLTFERMGDENINIVIKLYREENPERFTLSEPLARLLDTEEEDRAGVVMGIWGYIQEMGLQEDEESRRIRCDENLRAVFGQDVIYFPNIPDLIHKQLTPLPPVSLPYTIRVDKEYISPADDSSSSAPTIYDILVPIHDPFRAALSTLTHFGPPADAAQATTTRHTLAELARLDDTLALAISGITRAKAKHAFFGSMAADPARFINRWVSSQRRDLQVILGESRGGVGPVGSAGYGWEDGGREEWRWGGREGVWGSKGAAEAAGMYLGRMYAK